MTPLLNHDESEEQNDCNSRLRVPLPLLSSLRRLDGDFAALYLVPVSAEGSTSALLEAFHHRSPRVFIRICVYFLEKAVHGGVTACIRILVQRLVLL